MKKNESVKNIMSTKIHSATIQSKISDVKRIMQDHHINHVPVVSGKKLIGLVSRVDILRSSFSDLFVSSDKGADEQLDQVATIEDIMTRDINTISETDTVRDAAMRLASANFNSLPVLDANKDLVGIITTKDMIRYLIEKY